MNSHLKSVNVTVIQLDVQYKDKAANFEEVDKLLSNESNIGEITLLPELFSTGYLFDSPQEVYALSEDFSHSVTINELKALARRYQTTFVAGVCERQERECFNSVVIVNQTGLLHRYQKISQTSVDRAFYSRGRDLLTFELNGFTFGVVICFDIWFPEIMREYHGVDIVLHPSNFGGQQSFTFVRARALESGYHVITCNRVGRDNAYNRPAHFCGGSRGYDPSGEELFRLGDSQALTTITLTKPRLAPQYHNLCLEEEIKDLTDIFK
ncbi:carbon-nitrogen hydrolase family protein [Vibrio owensii]|uniref:carbon-nitrogen hydrolase family protein n=1 Tax=Vibrio owensii TaxID=696485 RepID=UPI001D116369|nr:carbon-nitrogen hydrolase family protein [Vibrio owensii]